MTKKEIQNKFKIFNYFQIIENNLVCPKLKLKITEIKDIETHSTMECFVLYLTSGAIIFYYYLKKDLHFEWTY